MSIIKSIRNMSEQEIFDMLNPIAILLITLIMVVGFAYS
jgi:hypothetical protein